MRGHMSGTHSQGYSIDKAVRYGQVGMALLITVVFVLLFDLATSGAGLLPETYVVLLVVYMLTGIIMGWLRVGDAIERIKSAPFLSLAAAGYLAADMLSAVYAPDFGIVWQKYKVAGGLLVAAAAVLLLAVTRERLDALMLTFGGSAAAAALTAWLGYLHPAVFPVYYRLRVSPRADYNMFATALLTGLICGGCALSLGRVRLRFGLRSASFFLLGSALLPTIFLSGSRRAYLMLIPVAAVLAFCWLSAAGPYKRTEGLPGRRIALLACLAIVCVLGTVGGRVIMESPRVNPMLLGEGGAGGAPNSETSALWRYTTADIDGLMSKRLGIYSVAAEELLDYGGANLLLGRGLGANILLYDRPDSRIDSLYPNINARIGNLSAHNMLLADMLDGGAVKVAARLSLLAADVWNVIKLIWLDARRGIVYAMTIGVAVTGGLVSGRFGLLYDRCFVLMGIMLLMEIGVMGQDEKSAHVKLPAQT